MKIVDTLEELKKQPPNIIIADCIKNIAFIQNHFKSQNLKKKNKYVMSLGIYQQLHYDMERNIKILKPSKIKFQNIYRPYSGQNLDNKILFVSRTGGIGDILFIQPNLVYLKNKYPTCKIIFGCGPQYQSMLEGWDCIDEIVNIPFPFSNLMKSDYHLFFEGVIERCKKAEKKNAYNLFSEWMGLNLEDKLLCPKQKPKIEKVYECKKILKEKFNIKEKDFIIIQMKASSPIRTPEPNWWLKIINKLTYMGYNILISDLPNEADGIDNFINYVNDKNKVFNFSKYSKTLDYCIAMTSLAQMILSVDSSLIHIAASLNIKSFGIFGPFPGKIRLSTYPNAYWIDANTNCSPCFIHGSNPCKKAIENNKKYSPCYQYIDINNLCDQVRQIYQKEIKND
jgi:ADP-heptose:LPS heptosyltransferase